MNKIDNLWWFQRPEYSLNTTRGQRPYVPVLNEDSSRNDVAAFTPQRVMTKPLRQLTEIENCLPNAILSRAKNYLEETLKYFSRYMNRIVMQMEFIN